MGRRPRSGRLSALVAGAAALLGSHSSSAAAPEPPPQPPEPEPQAREAEGGERQQERPPPAVAAGWGEFEVVRPGDTLWSVARRFAGEEDDEAAVAAEAARIWRLNADRIGTGDPGVLLPGTVLRVR